MGYFKRIKTKDRLFYCCLFLFMLYPVTAQANSSWHWVTSSPVKVLPLAVVLTLVIETCGVIIYGKVKEKLMAFIVVQYANFISFIMPYVVHAYAIKFHGVGVGSGWDYALDKAANSGPNYIVRFGYLMLTLFIELPIVYYFLKKRSRNKKQLLTAIIIANIITTVIVAVMERILCRGQW